MERGSANLLQIKFVLFTEKEDTVGGCSSASDLPAPITNNRIVLNGTQLPKHVKSTDKDSQQIHIYSPKCV